MNKPQPTSLKPVKSILVSQPKPPEVPKSPYQEIAEKYKIKVEFRQFIQVRGLSSKDFRKQRINILDYTAVIFTSRNAIDHFFRICEELRIRMPEMTKYFCVTEAIAVYLQKYIQYRKRKVFFGTGKDTDMFDLFKKHIS
ncbi:MAG TPA: uroporphyrinogen-III synthase, partial [Chitinophagales bacterium]|nr:uroporphyrinogen-III synthase [Chitinophagales bacterium]